jgi:hypothetical protein
MLTRRTLLWLLLAGLLLLSVTTSAVADAATQITWYVLSSGGGHAASTNYQVDFTMGQPAPGAASSPSYLLGSGFWYVMGAPEVPPVTQVNVYLPVVLKRYP